MLLVNPDSETVLVKLRRPKYQTHGKGSKLDTNPIAVFIFKYRSQSTCINAQACRRRGGGEIDSRTLLTLMTPSSREFLSTNLT